MAIWKEQTAPIKEPPLMPQPSAPQSNNIAPARTPSYDTPSSRSSQSDAKETLIAANLCIWIWVRSYHAGSFGNLTD